MGRLILTELQTLQAAVTGTPIARFGDGELRLAVGGGSVSQRPDPALQMALQAILHGLYAPYCLTCIPRLDSVPRTAHWAFYEKYGAEQFTSLYGPQVYGSTWVTRADCAPWIDTPDYWEIAASLWAGRDVTVVAGASNMVKLIRDRAAGITSVPAPKRDAYAELPRIIEEVGRPSGPVLISLGAAGTVLAAKLARHGVWAVDVGHIFMFADPKHQGAFSFTVDDFATPEYRAELRQAHADHLAIKGRWGKSGGSHWPWVKAFVDRVGGKWVLDFGSGAETFKPVAEKDGYRVEQFDAGTDQCVMPKQVDVSFSSDVLEHVEPEKIDNVLRFLYLIARKGGIHKIALLPANKTLPGGRNAHILLLSPAEWLKRFQASGWTSCKITIQTHKHVTIECLK